MHTTWMHAHTHAPTQTRTRAHAHTNTRTHAHTHTHTHQSHTRAIRALRLKKSVFLKKGFQGRFKRVDRGRMADRNRELVPDNWSLVRERALTAGLCSEGWDSGISCWGTPQQQDRTESLHWRAQLHLPPLHPSRPLVLELGIWSSLQPRRVISGEESQTEESQGQRGESRTDRDRGESRTDWDRGESRTDRDRGESRTDRDRGESRTDRDRGESRTERRVKDRQRQRRVKDRQRQRSVKYAASHRTARTVHWLFKSHDLPSKFSAMS